MGNLGSSGKATGYMSTVPGFGSCIDWCDILLVNVFAAQPRLRGGGAQSKGLPERKFM